MSDSEINEDDDIIEQENDVEIMDDNAESDAIEGEEEQKETQFEEQPQIAIERVNRIKNLLICRTLGIRQRRRIYSRMKTIRWEMLYDLC
jgi:hypothetical protein